MTDLKSILRTDLVILAVYLALIVALLIAEKVLGASVPEKWSFVVGSAGYVFFIMKNHWVTNDPDNEETPAVTHIGVCLLAIIGGLFLGIVGGVNLKFLLGLSV